MPVVESTTNKHTRTHAHTHTHTHMLLGPSVIQKMKMLLMLTMINGWLLNLAF